MNEKRILIIGGGFGGVRAALALDAFHLPGVKVALVTDKPHFEYHAALYRIVTGKSPLEVCIPLREVFRGTSVELITDTITAVDPAKKSATGSSGSAYAADAMVLALGSETAYFNVPGLEEFSFGFKSITEALRLKEHIHQLFTTCSAAGGAPGDDVCRMHFVVVGAGASGVELAGELAAYTKKLATVHGVPPSLIAIDLIDAAPRVLPAFPENVSERIAARLRALGVNLFTNRPIVRESSDEVVVKGLDIKTDTVIWTAGVKPSGLFQKIPGLAFDKKGRVVVDGYLRAQGFENLFVIGDGAATQYSGMAQTAVRDGQAAAENIRRSLAGEGLLPAHPKKPYYAVPVGPGWAAAMVGPFTLYGWAGWIVRRAADFRYFLSILPLSKAIAAFRSGKTLCEACQVCLPESKGSGVA